MSAPTPELVKLRRPWLHLSLRLFRPRFCNMVHILRSRFLSLELVSGDEWRVLYKVQTVYADANGATNSIMIQKCLTPPYSPYYQGQVCARGEAADVPENKKHLRAEPELEAGSSRPLLFMFGTWQRSFCSPPLINRDRFHDPQHHHDLCSGS